MVLKELTVESQTFNNIANKKKMKYNFLHALIHCLFQSSFLYINLDLIKCIALMKIFKEITNFIVV